MSDNTCLYVLFCLTEQMTEEIQLVLSQSHRFHNYKLNQTWWKIFTHPLKFQKVPKCKPWVCHAKSNYLYSIDIVLVLYNQSKDDLKYKGRCA